MKGLNLSMHELEPNLGDNQNILVIIAFEFVHFYGTLPKIWFLLLLNELVLSMENFPFYKLSMYELESNLGKAWINAGPMGKVTTHCSFQQA